jgi:hypothetical protein
MVDVRLMLRGSLLPRLKCQSLPAGNPRGPSRLISRPATSRSLACPRMRWTASADRVRVSGCHHSARRSRPKIIHPLCKGDKIAIGDSRSDQCPHWPALQTSDRTSREVRKVPHPTSLFRMSYLTWHDHHKNFAGIRSGIESSHRLSVSVRFSEPSAFMIKI